MKEKAASIGERIRSVRNIVHLSSNFTDRLLRRRMACARLLHKYIPIFPALGATAGHSQSKDDQWILSCPSLELQLSRSSRATLPLLERSGTFCGDEVELLCCGSIL
jgi:hypothetical protein